MVWSHGQMHVKTVDIEIHRCFQGMVETFKQVVERLGFALNYALLKEIPSNISINL
jgi:hypothetical protein